MTQKSSPGFTPGLPSIKKSVKDTKLSVQQPAGCWTFFDNSRRGVIASFRKEHISMDDCWLSIHFCGKVIFFPIVIGINKIYWSAIVQKIGAR